MDEDYLKHTVSLEGGQIEQLITHYWGDIWNYVYIMIHDRATSDDLTQETFLRAFRSLSSFRGQSSYRTWLLRIARNLTINYKRSALFRRVVLMGDVLSGRKSVSAEAEFWKQQEVDTIWRYVRELSPKLREVLILDAKYEMSVKEIAGLLSVPEGTVKSRLNRARGKMSLMLKGELFDE